MNKTSHTIILFCFVLFSLFCSLSADQKHSDFILELQAGDILQIGDSCWIVPHDTTFIITDSIPFFVQKDTESTDQFYDTMQSEADKSNIAKQIFNFAFKKEKGI